MTTAAIGTAAPQQAPARPVVPSAGPTVEKRVSDGQLTLKLSSHVAFAPADVLVQMRLEPDARSRTLSVEWWSADGVGGSHEVSLEGDRAAARQSYSIKRMEAGEYIVTAAVIRNDGTRVIRTTNVVVVEKGQSVTSAGFGPDDLTATGPRVRGR